MTTNWKPNLGIAIVLGILIQPFVFLYVNRGVVFFLYLPILTITAFFDLTHSTHYSLIFMILCPSHAAYISKNYRSDESRHWYSCWWGIATSILFFYLPILLIRSFFYEPFSIPASSMAPTINTGDFIIVKKYGYGNYGTYGINLWNPGLSDYKQLKKGSIYVFISPSMNIPLTKRLIGTAGDNIKIESNIILVNGKPIETVKTAENYETETWKENYGDSVYSTFRTIGAKTTSFSEIVVPDNQYYFLGDHRNNSNDSRYWGTVSKDKIIGEVVYIYSSK
jgi:signal peptidase I